MASFKSKADAWLARNNGLTTVIFLGMVLAPIAWLFLTDEGKPREENAPAPPPEIVQLKKKSLLCYERDDWLAMIASIQDSNLQRMRVLMEDGKCLQTSGVERVSFLNPFLTGSALIQMPSGRPAYILQADIQR